MTYAESKIDKFTSYRRFQLSSSGNSVFTVSSSLATTVTFNGAKPQNNYAGTSLLLGLSGSIPSYNMLKYSGIKLTIKGSMTQAGLYVLYASAFTTTFSGGSVMSISPGFKTIQTNSNGEFEETIEFSEDFSFFDFFSYGLVIGGDSGTLNVTAMTFELEYITPYAIDYQFKTPSYNATENINLPITFSWELICEEVGSGPVKSYIAMDVSSYKLYWKGENEADEKAISVGTTSNAEIGAGTFSGYDRILWRIAGTMKNGLEIRSYPLVSNLYPSRKGYEALNLIDADTPSDASAIYPKNIAVDGTSIIEFQWQHYNSSGTAQTRADLQTGTTPDQLTDFATIQGAANTYSAPANSFTAGDLYWRVRTYNADGIAGEWSETAHIIVIAASSAPLISLERISPRPIIRWETNGQVAFEIEIVGIETSVSYGAENRYVAKTVLPDGRYTVRVRIQNKYALWSPWAEAALSIVNSPGGTISLSATASKIGEVQLSWSTTGAFTAYQILRNGAVIGETTERSYLDRLAIGTCSYQIRGIVDSAGNYSLSGVQALTVTVPTVQIAPVSGGDWLALPYTTTDIREVTVSISKTVTYQQFLGASLPVGVVGEALSKSVQLSCAFPYRLQADAAKLEALIGQLVCVKDPPGRRYLGILGSMSHVSSRFYLSYSLTITPVTCEEVDL